MTKKINTTKLVALLAVLCMITSVFVGSTLAKYTSSATGTATARVAKWGFENSTIEIGNLFSTTYNTESDKVIAPGTSGSASFTFTPDENVTPEVPYTLSINTDGSTIDDAIKSNPAITWKLDGNTVEGGWDALLTAIAAKGGDGNGATTISGTVGWDWAFGDGTNDAADTALGNAGGNVTLVINVTATQTAQ